MEKISINTISINLDQFLKLVSAVDSGGKVKLLIADGLIKVNGNLVTERRKKLYSGDIVEVEELGCWEVADQENP
ncbi:MAG: putative binding protein [Firmicutes bacterium]|nr:putative binding protein [Bacillota bacterium]